MRFSDINNLSQIIHTNGHKISIFMTRIKASIAIFCLMVIAVFNVMQMNSGLKDRSLEKVHTLVFPNSNNKKVGIVSECNSPNIELGRSYNESSINAFDCIFSRMAMLTGSGGVICVTSAGLSLNITECIFSNCSCSYQGGAIYFLSLNATMRKVCAFRCSSNAYYHFGYLGSTQAKEFSLLSISYCSYSAVQSYSLSLNDGTHTSNIYQNSSNNKAMQQSAIIFFHGTSFSSSYGSYVNNTVSVQVCIEFCYVVGSMTYSNIIGNNSPAYGVINSNGSGITVSYCIMQNNTNALFCVVFGGMTIANSMISHSDTWHASTNVATSNLTTNIMVPTYDIPFFNSHYCLTLFDSIATPVSTPEKTLVPTPNATPVSTPEETLVPTPCESPVATPYRSYDEGCNCSSDSSLLGNDYTMTAIIYSIALMLLIIIAICISRCCRSQAVHEASMDSEKKSKKRSRRH